MLKPRWAVVVCLAMIAGVGTSRVLAHHSFAMFDTAKRLNLAGTVTAFEWTNPHVYIEVDVPDDKGIVKHWTVELGSPSILMQGGWKFSDVKVGDKISLSLSPLRSGEPGGLLAQITLRDGRVLGNGPGPTGARP
ncbi:MAG TPA: DUF6152 family protein [Vicinamibacterales bacterium]|nr:DUF6152 family protein [Vicinamibacterales bacterium]